MSGAHSRSKGQRGEREVCELARQFGLKAERTWHTAQSPNPDERACDVTIAGDRCQVKRGARGFKALYDGLEFVDALYTRSDGKPWLVTLRAEDYLRQRAAAPWVGAHKGDLTMRKQHKRLAHLRRHFRLCAICAHPQRKQIEDAFIHWQSPAHIAQKYCVRRHSVYRHARALGLFEVRERTRRKALERFCADAAAENNSDGLEPQPVDRRADSVGSHDAPQQEMDSSSVISGPGTPDSSD